MTYLLLDTSTPTCHLSLVTADNEKSDYHWLSDRQLAHGLLKFLVDSLAEHNLKLADLSGIGVMKGPGSFTGLRIGLTVANTLADSLNIPIVGAEGEDWQRVAEARLSNQETDNIVQPSYGAAAHITKPRK